jgi:DNA-binding SARP family transcriptional activator
MRFRILGPLEVWDGGRRLAVGRPQQRALLAVLLLHANRVVSTDLLVSYLWDERPPAAARELVQGDVARLRRALRTNEASGQPLQTRPPGYLLEVRPGELDYDRFEELAANAGRVAAEDSALALERAAALLHEALSLWRGPALDDVALAVCQTEAARLEERRLAVLEERVEVDLRLGRHASLVSELQTAVRTHPLRERLWAQLMTALYGVDRQADALAAYGDLRRILVEQLGIEPAPLQAGQAAWGQGVQQPVHPRRATPPPYRHPPCPHRDGVHRSARPEPLADRRSMSWLMRSRRLVRRYDRLAEHFLGFATLACRVICYRRLTNTTK